MKKINLAFVSVLTLLIMVNLCPAQDMVVAPDLTEIVNGDGWTIFNRGDISIVEGDESDGVYLNAQPGDGLVLLEGYEFTNGIIEADIKGRDVQGQSFVGIAFRGVDETTFDAVYFRPFNFLAEDPVRHGHGVQYISHPANTWFSLRSEHPEEYENPVTNVPDPDAFFHVKLVIEKPTVEVYVNDAESPCLVVDELTERTGGRIGLYVGNFSDGTFKNLRITPEND